MCSIGEGAGIPPVRDFAEPHDHGHFRARAHQLGSLQLGPLGVTHLDDLIFVGELPGLVYVGGIFERRMPNDLGLRGSGRGGLG